MNEFSWISICALMCFLVLYFYLHFIFSIGWFDWKVFIFALKFFILNEKGFNLNVIQYVIVRYKF